MSISNEFKEAVHSKDVLLVHIMLKDSLLMDPTAAQFHERERYASEYLSDLYDIHDGEELVDDINMWDEDYLSQQMVAVVSNFSRERIDLLKRMARHLFKEKAAKIQEERNSAGKERNYTHKQIGTGVTVAGAALTVAGICTSQTVLTVGGVVVAVAGVALIMSDKGNS